MWNSIYRSINEGLPNMEFFKTFTFRDYVLPAFHQVLPYKRCSRLQKKCRPTRNLTKLITCAFGTRVRVMTKSSILNYLKAVRRDRCLFSSESVYSKTFCTFSQHYSLQTFRIHVIWLKVPKLPCWLFLLKAFIQSAIRIEH